MIQQSLSDISEFDWHSPKPDRPNPAAQIVFAIPVKDEEESISACIQALENQYNSKGKRIPWSEYEALILVNNTTDATIQQAMKARRHPGIHIASVQLSPQHAHIGWARRTAMEWCSERLRQGRQARGLIVSTDADSQIAPDFIYELRRSFIDPEVDAVGASLQVEDGPSDRLFDSLHSYFTLERQLRLFAQENATFDLMHTHFSGAGFAVRQCVYEEVGGLTPFPYNEDKHFYHKLVQRDARIRMCDRLMVYTSGRLSGRTEWGMAAQFSHWQKAEESGEPIFVSSAQSQWIYFQLQMALYAFWLARTEEKLATVCHYLQVCQIFNPMEFLAKIEIPSYFGQYWCCVWEHPKLVEGRQRTFPNVTVNDSLAGFGELLAGLDNKLARRA
ncbi:glycosyltransferase [Persicitalea jodogahamensis]|uniref:Glycosyltransferase 2-like domain-containing protein n=1 Tax=Persicitalea jodogahamensis TaxID=402147 RepID=A0A8J3G9K8_9BACT|nr:glycosyltransferase [Persicitalea jodogahamensis]GHB67631.1 hypothetical protein GCM10007390_21170 [Persicitalea jodogahamensis]